MGDDGLHAIRLAIILSRFHAKKYDTDFYCFPFGWKTNLTKEATHTRYLELQNELKPLLKKYETISLMGVSTGVALSLLYTTKNLKKIKSVLAFCGCIQYDKKYLDTILHEGFESIVKDLDTVFKDCPALKASIAKKTLVVHGKKDEIVPIRLQKLAGATQYEIGYTTHLLATTVGVIQHLTQGKKSPLWQWLVNGPTQIISNNTVLT